MWIPLSPFFACVCVCGGGGGGDIALLVYLVLAIRLLLSTPHSGVQCGANVPCNYSYTR